MWDWGLGGGCADGDVRGTISDANRKYTHVSKLYPLKQSFVHEQWLSYFVIWLHTHTCTHLRALSTYAAVISGDWWLSGGTGGNVRTLADANEVSQVSKKYNLLFVHEQWLSFFVIWLHTDTCTHAHIYLH